ncbi:MAG: hypothetical protein Q7V63_09530 [Gammaproteobacteria bacterium]|nr:hypothetical protein [Gammaproteobacteria bacterium]
MTLNELLACENTELKNYIDARFYIDSSAKKLAEIKELKPDFDESQAGASEIIMALCRFEHFLEVHGRFLSKLEHHIASLAGTPEEQARGKAILDEIIELDNKANRELLAKKAVGDIELGRVLPEDSLITLRRMQAIIGCFPKRIDLYREMAADVVKAKIEGLAPSILIEDAEASSMVGSTRPIQAAGIDTHQPDDSCCIS